jgi:hypothetical protein
MVEVGSMEIVGLFKDMNLFSSLAKIKTELRTVTEHVKSTTTEMFRMSNQSKMLSKFLGMIGVGGFAALLMTMPRVGTQLEIIHMYLELIALIMDETLGPAMEWVAEKFGDLYHWFKDLDPEAQEVITWLTVIGGLLLGGLGIAGVLGKLGALKTALLGIGGATGGATLAAAAIGLLAGGLAVLALDEMGALDYISDLGKGFREIGDTAGTTAESKWLPLYDTIMLVFGGFAMLGDIILWLVGLREWDDVVDNAGNVKKSMDRLLPSIHKVIDGLKQFSTVDVKYKVWGPLGSLYGMTQHAVGGFASYTGPHWLEAGESVGMKDTESASSFGGGDTTINNNYDGATFVLTNGLDIDDFIEMTSRKQAQKSAWGAF